MAERKRATSRKAKKADAEASASTVAVADRPREVKVQGAGGAAFDVEKEAAKLPDRTTAQSDARAKMEKINGRDASGAVVAEGVEGDVEATKASAKAYKEARAAAR